MTALLVDTDVVIWILRGRPEYLTGLRNARLRGPILISPVTVAEIHAGARPKEISRIEELLGAMGRIPIEEKVARLAGQYLREYGRGRGVELADALVAASAVVSGLPLWTLNRKHYPMPEIRLYRPAGD